MVSQVTFLYAYAGSFHRHPVITQPLAQAPSSMPGMLGGVLEKMDTGSSWSTGKGWGAMDARSSGHELHQGKPRL